MTRYRLTRRAQKEVDEIADYTLAHWGDAKAGNYIDDLYSRFEWLAENPMLGRTRDEVREGARSFRQGAHMIFYRIERDGIVIVGLPHASVDFDRYFD